MAAPVAGFVISDGTFAVATARYDGRGTGFASQAPQLVGIVALVAQQVTHGPGPFEKLGAAFMSLTLPGVSISA